MREEMLKEFFPQNAFDLEWELSKFHRSKGGIGFSKAIETLQNFVGKSEVIRYSLNKTYETWKMPRGWNLKDGFLKIANGPYVVGSLALSPISAIFLSGKTNGVEKLKVVDVRSGEDESDYKKSVLNNAILASGDPTKVYSMAKKFGVRCVLSYFMRAQEPSIQRSPEMLPDAVNYTSFPVDSDESLFGFALSYNQYLYLKSLVKKELKIEAFLDADHGSDELEILEAHVGKNTKERPIILTAHLCHPKPGANDNASGSALLAEIVRVLRKFEINREIIALWVPEMYGTIAYLTDHKTDFEFDINLDMVGENQILTGSTLDISATPWSSPSFINELIGVHLENSKFRTKEDNYSGGSDHYIFVDSTIGIQSVSLTQWPDRYYHTSEDTPDKACVESFDWIGRGVIETMADTIEGTSEETSNKTVEKIFGKFIKNGSNNREVKNWIGFRTYKSLEAFSKYSKVRDLQNYLKNHVDLKSIPKQKKIKEFKGPLGDSWMDEKDKEWEFNVLKKYPFYRDYKDEFLNFLDLGFSIENAMKIASEEFGVKTDFKEQTEYLVERLKKERLLG
jgi:aminopeptidase-like protein